MKFPSVLRHAINAARCRWLPCQVIMSSLKLLKHTHTHTHTHTLLHTHTRKNIHKHTHTHTHKPHVNTHTHDTYCIYVHYGLAFQLIFCIFYNWSEKRTSALIWIRKVGEIKHLKITKYGLFWQLNAFFCCNTVKRTNPFILTKKFPEKLIVVCKDSVIISKIK